MYNFLAAFLQLESISCQAKVNKPNPPPKVHDKVITWVEHHPLEAGEMISASADGVVKVWHAG
jgi:hypothetical protein